MFDNTSETFGTLLKYFRKRQHLTQRQLAEAIGMHRNTIGRWEEGSFLPESKALILELARYLHLMELEARQLLDASLIAPTPLWSVPYPRNPFFTGRENLLALLHASLGPGQQTALTRSYALHGMGGIGKTQLALEYAHRYALEYSAVFWIGAETLEQIYAGLLSIAQRLDLPERVEPDQQRMVAAVQRWLETRSEWLLIWDNLEDLDLFQRFLPSLRQGTILITTRHRALGTLAYDIDLTPMEEVEAMLFLFRRARILGAAATAEQVHELAVTKPGDYAAALELVTTLGGLPLALDQAGAYIEETKCSLADFLTLFQQAPLRLLQERGAHAKHPASVATTFALAFEQLQQHYPAAAELLTACCFLAPEEIPESLFTRHAMLLPSVLQQALVEPFEFHEMVKRLLAYALIQRQSDRQTLVVHRLVQTVLRERMSMHERTEWMKRMIRVLNAAIPKVTHDAWEECERLRLHVQACTAALPDELAEPEILAEVLSKAADYLRERAHYGQAELFYQRALSLLEQVAGSDSHLNLVPLLNRLALLHRAQGKYVQAEALYERALHILEQVPAPEHLLKAQTLYNLGMLCQEQGKYKQAEHVFGESLRLTEDVFPYVAYALHGLANIYMEQEKNEQAVVFFQRALRLWEHEFGPEHLLVAYPLHNLAMLAQRQGEDRQAEQLSKCALRIAEQALGPEHPQVAHPLNGLADLYTEQGKYKQAELLYQRALHIRQKALGTEHADLATSLNGLAHLYQEEGKDEQAEPLYQQALSIREKRLGQHHPEIAQTLHNLAILRQKQGNLHEALSFAERALNIRMQSLGETHPKTVTSRVYHAQLLQELKNCRLF